MAKGEVHVHNWWCNVGEKRNKEMQRKKNSKWKFTYGTKPYLFCCSSNRNFSHRKKSQVRTLDTSFECFFLSLRSTPHLIRKRKEAEQIWFSFHLNMGIFMNKKCWFNNEKSIIMIGSRNAFPGEHCARTMNTHFSFFFLCMCNSFVWKQNHND